MTWKLTAWALAALVVAPTMAVAEPFAEVVRARIAASLPAELAVAELHLAATMASREVDPGSVAVSWPRPPRVGTASVRVVWAGRQRRFVSVTLARRSTVVVAARAIAPGALITEQDLTVAERALPAGARPAMSPVGQVARIAIEPGRLVELDALMPAPLIGAGAAVSFEVRRNAVRVTGRGTLERSARLGQSVLVRWTPDRPPLRGTLVASDRVVLAEVTP